MLPTAMSRHVDWEIDVHLEHKATFNDLGNKEDYFKAVQDRYASKYCVELGVEPLAHHKSYIARHAPLAECEIEAYWSDAVAGGVGSACASKLRIAQPQISRTQSAVVLERVQSDAQRNAEWCGKAKYMSVSPPGASHEAERTRIQLQGRAKQESAQRNLNAQALEAMQRQDMLSSGRNDTSLTDELERRRKQIRSDLEAESSKADVFGRLLANKGKQEAAEKELASLKAKFLLPFACEGLDCSKYVPWQDPQVKNHPAIDVLEEFSADALKHISLTLSQIEEETFRYVLTSFPVELLTTRVDVELFAAIREQLVTEESVRLIGLLAHFLYWIILEHVHEPSQRLPEQSKQSLVLTIQDLWCQIQAPARQRLGRRGELLSKDGPAGISFVIPAFMLALKRGVEWCFTVEHPWIFQEQSTTQHFVDQVNIMFLKLFDPDCHYAGFGALEASSNAIKGRRELRILKQSIGLSPATEVLHQEYRTTPLMSLLLNSDGGNPSDPKTRVLLAKSSSEPMFGSPQEHGKPQERMPLDGWRRAALYRSANKRLSGLQRSGLAVAGKSASETEKTKNNFMKSSLNKSGTIRGKPHLRSQRTSTVGSESTPTML